MADPTLQNDDVGGQQAQSPGERWLPVVGYEGLYEVSSLGRVRSLDRIATRTVRGQPHPYRCRGRIRVPHFDENGRPRILLCKNGQDHSRRVHSLVAEAFIGPRPEGLVLCHRDGDNTNNRLGNLRYGTQASNIADALDHGTLQTGRRHYRTSLSDDDVREIRRLSATKKQAELAAMYGCQQTAISRIIHRKNWKYVE